MATVEYEGIKMSGSKLLIILPLLGTLIGGLWGGFELYNRLLDAEEKLENLQPEVIEQEIMRLTELTEVIKDNLQGDIVEASRLARDVESSSAKTQREVRDDVYEMEREMQERFKEQDKEMREMRKELEERIQTILENPLNDVE
jgi:gas vesicle protein|tara:strand:- start:1190 stop:1621 length:432 start_codon:yes stop_codon:yes gene_type:complete